jgi:putative flippase GtrA
MPRWVAFNLVGVIGFAVQMGALGLLLHLDVPYLVATALAVEAAVLHNFLWHERWTWRDRPAAGCLRTRRLLHFHLLNGLVSIVGNVALVWALVSGIHLAPLLANAIAVVVLSVVNYRSGDRMVFKDEARCSRLEDTGCGMRDAGYAIRDSRIGDKG